MAGRIRVVKMVGLGKEYSYYHNKSHESRCHEGAHWCHTQGGISGGGISVMSLGVMRVHTGATHREASQEVESQS